MIIERNKTKCQINSSVTNWDYMDDFLQALCNVDLGYYMYSPAHTGNADRVRDEVYTERIFAYEFYHQYRCIMDSDDKKKRYIGISLNGEQTNGPVIENITSQLNGQQNEQVERKENLEPVAPAKAATCAPAT